MPKLGVNIDHVATLRQARQEHEPSPIEAALIAEHSGANTIVCHLREDRRHIQDKDVFDLKKILKKPINLEMSLSKNIIDIALKVKPKFCMFVPEKRQEVTTEGGLDVIRYARRLKSATSQLTDKGIIVSVFIDPIKKHIDAACYAGVSIVELHTGTYANAKTKIAKQKQLAKIKSAAKYAKEKGLIVHAGHGLKYHDVKPVAKIKYIDELNIGHSIISRSVVVGLARAVREMKALVS
ncbi:MAG: pyridoxine 5-phosphate synthase [Lysobacterales bacterium]|jgi:pyridoxine 5-phosphate synthase